jgi:hypothetical protein
LAASASEAEAAKPQKEKLMQPATKATAEEASLFSKVYVPAPHKPEWFDGALARIFGYNTFNKPRMVVEWGCDARWYRNGNPQALKYPNPANPRVGIDRWILAEWTPPHFFGNPDDWERERYLYDETGTKRDLLGDYPSEGLYTMVMPLCTSEGNYIPASMQVVEWCEALLKDMHHSTWTPQNALVRLRQQEERISREMKTDEESVDKAVEELTDYYNTRGSRIDVVHSTEYSKNLVTTPESIKRVQQQLRGH